MDYERETMARSMRGEDAEILERNRRVFGYACGDDQCSLNVHSRTTCEDTEAIEAAEREVGA